MLLQRLVDNEAMTAASHASVNVPVSCSKKTVVRVAAVACNSVVGDSGSILARAK